MIFIEASFPKEYRSEEYRKALQQIRAQTALQRESRSADTEQKDGEAAAEKLEGGAHCVALVSFHTIAMHDQVHNRHA